MSVRCSLVYDGAKMHLIDSPFPTLEMIEAVLGESKPYGVAISEWLCDNDFAVLDNLDLNTVRKLSGWCIDYE